MESDTASAVRKSSRRSWFRSLYSRIALTFLLLLIALRAAQGALFYLSWQDVAQASDQLLDWDLADELVPTIEPLLAGTIDRGALDQALHLLQQFRPQVTAYILDTEGTIRAYFGNTSDLKLQKLDTAPIERFLKGPEQSLPILIPDPQRPERRISFSAARVKLADSAGYLLLGLRSHGREFSATLLLRSDAIRSTSLGVAVALLATALVGLIVFSWLTRPLRNLATSVRRFQEGDLASRFEGGSSDEIGELGRSFNAMAETISQNIALLEQTDQQRRQLIANVSHDLRGPLTSITGFLSTLQESEGRLTDEMIARCHEIIHRNAQLLNRMIEELFDLAKFEAKESPVEAVAVEAATTLPLTIERYALLAEQSGIALELALEDPAITFRADPFLLDRALSNLIENALRYTPRGGRVTLHVGGTTRGARLAVTDTGRGIPPEEVSQLFARFYQADLARKNAGAGAGLGLAIAQRIVEAHGSRIEIDSVVGSGTSFHFELHAA